VDKPFKDRARCVLACKSHYPGQTSNALGTAYLIDEWKQRGKFLKLIANLLQSVGAPERAWIYISVAITCMLQPQSLSAQLITDNQRIDDSLTCGEPSFERSQDRDIFIWNDCGTDNWHVMSSAGPNGPNGERVYLRFAGDISSSDELLNVRDSGRTLERGDRVSVSSDQTGIDFEFGMASGFNGIDSILFTSRPDASLCLDMTRFGSERRVLFGATGNIVSRFPVNMRNLGPDCLSRCDDGVQNGDETDIDCGGSCRPCSDAPFVSQCLSRRADPVRLQGAQRSRYRLSSVPDDSVFDATGAVWSGIDSNGDAIPWTVTMRNAGSGANSCWYGGEINGPWDETADDVSWEDPFHHSGAMTIDIPDFLFEAVRVNNQGDGLRPYGDNSRIRSVWLTDIHDDCVENDDLYSLTIEDSLFDGCYSGFSARPHVDNPPDGSSNVWTIRDSLIRLEPQPTVYRGPVPGHGGFFKWHGGGNSPRVSLHNTVFRADQVPNHGRLGIPTGLSFESCSNNTMVWLGEGAFPEPLPDCFRITTDRQVWDDAVSDWRIRHAGVFE